MKHNSTAPSFPSALFSPVENSPALHLQLAAAFHPSTAMMRAVHRQAHFGHFQHKAMAVRLEEAGTVRHRPGAVLHQGGMGADRDLEKTHTDRDRGLDQGRRVREVGVGFRDRGVGHHQGGAERDGIVHHHHHQGLEEGGGVRRIVLTAAIAGAGVVVEGGMVGGDDIAKVEQSNVVALLLVLAKCGFGSTISVRYED